MVYLGHLPFDLVGFDSSPSRFQIITFAHHIILFNVDSFKSTFDDAKVEITEKVQKNKNQLTNNNYLSADYQIVNYFVIKKNKLRYTFL